MTRRTIQVYSQSLAKAKKRRIDRPSHILRKACSKTFAAKKIPFSDDETFIWGLYNQHSFIKFKLAVGHGPVSDVFLLLISFALYVCMYEQPDTKWTWKTEKSCEISSYHLVFHQTNDQQASTFNFFFLKNLQTCICWLVQYEF